MKKLIWTVVILAVVALFGGRAWYLYQHRVQGKNIVKIATAPGLSGQWAFIGQDYANGAKLAAEEINAQQKGYTIDLIIRDAKPTAKDGINAFHYFTSQQVDALLIMGDNQTPAVAPLVVQKKIPAVASVVGTQDFLSHNKEKTYIFLNWPSSYVGSAFVGKFAKNDLKLKNIALFQMTGLLGEESAKGFQEGFGKKYITTEKFRDSDMDLKSQVAKIMYHNPDGIFIVGYGAGFIAAINQLKEAQFTGVILSDNKAGDTNTKAVVKDLSNIYYYDIAKIDDELSQHFAQAYLKRFGSEPSEFAKTGYDSVMRIAQAIETEGKDHIREGLAEIQEMNTTSGHLKFLPNGQVQFPLVIKQMMPDGTAKVIKE